jgi:uncharacterized membrane protein
MGARQRHLLVDVARGGAIVMMAAYHFTFDLNHFFRLGLDFNGSPLWLSLRAVIVSLFLGLVGISLHLATRDGLDRRRYARRLGAILLCALLVTVASRAMFPRSYIYFGILHFIALASVLALPMTRFFRLNLWLGLALVAIGLWFRHPLFDQPGLQWIGLMTHKPVTEDYVPVLPWLGVVLVGLYVGRLLYPVPPAAPTALGGWRSGGRLPRLLALGGRHSLLIYMAHQPLFFAVLYLYTLYA